MPTRPMPMRDDERNARPVAEPAEEPQALPFYYTPMARAVGTDEDNPHAKASTHVPEVVEALQERFGEEVHEVDVYAGEHTVRVARERIAEVGRFLKDEQGFTYLVDLGGIDRFVEGERYEVFYNLVDIAGRRRLRLKVRVDEEGLTVPTVTSVWRAANWNEREVYDMLGIRFDGHPDLRRMYMPEDFEHHPQRKEFPLLGIPGSLPLPPQTPEGELNYDPFAAAHGRKPVKSYEEPEAAGEDD